MVDGINVHGPTDSDTSAREENVEVEKGSTVEFTDEQRQLDETAVWKGKYVRLLADLENTKKRIARNATKEVEAEKEALLLEVLPVADGLDLALLHISNDTDSRNIVQGIELVRDLLRKFFSDYQVKEIEAWGKKFDPRVHDAVGVSRNPKFPSNTVVKVQQKGYFYRDKLLRPAQVLVNQS